MATSIEQREHLNSPNATEQDVVAYILEHQQYIISQGGKAIPIEQYWQAGDLERYRAAKAAWATDAPPRWALPDLASLLKGCAGGQSENLWPFMRYLEHMWSNYSAWMASQKRDVNYPNETPNQRRTRKARESMARSRERNGDASAQRKEQLEETKRLYDAYIDACRERRRINEEQSELVAQAKARYDEARAKG